MRSPCDSASLMISRICFSASSTSFAGRCFCLAVMISMSSDLVMRSALSGTDVLLQQVPEAGARRRRFRAVALHRLGLLVSLLGLDRQRDGARLAVDPGELRLDLIAHLEHRAGVLHPLTAELGGAQLALDAVAQIDDRAADVDLLHHTLDDRALGVVGDIGGERILRQLFDAERDALALRVDRQHHGLELLALLVVAHRLFARLVPGDIRQVHQPVDVALQTYENAEVGDRLDLARHLVALVVVLGELLPGIGLALLETERYAAPLLVHVQHHHLDFLPGVHHLGGIDVLVGPVHLRDVYQALDAVLDLHERAVVGDVGDLAEHAGTRRVAARDVLPRIRAQLLEPQAHARALAVELQNAHLDLVAHLDDLGRMLDALPRHVGDVQQAVDPAQIDERAVVGEVLDRAAHHRAFLQVLHERAALGGKLLLDHGAARHHDVVAFLIELDDLELERLAFQIGGVAHRTHVHQRPRQERPHVLDLHREAALDAPGDDAGHDLGLVECLLESRPGACALGLLARQARLAGTVLDRIERDFHLVAGLDLHLAAFVLELLEGNHGLGLEAYVDDDDVRGDVDDEPGKDHPRADALIGETLLEELGETFCHTFTLHALPACPLGPSSCGPGKKHRAPASCACQPRITFRACRDERPQGPKRRAAIRSSTRPTTAPTPSPVASITQASGAGRNGAI